MTTPNPTPQSDPVQPGLELTTRHGVIVQSLWRGRIFICDREPTRPARIIAEVAARHGLSVDRLRGPSRRPEICHPRQEAMYRLRRETSLSYPAIARRLGRSDHTTAIHAERAHAARMGPQ